MSPEDNFLARGRNLSEIEIKVLDKLQVHLKNKIKVKVAYSSLDGLLDVYDDLGIGRENICTFCVGGEQPF